MKKYFTFKQILFLFFSLFYLSVMSQVGIGTDTPNATLDIVNNAPTGNSIEITDNSTTNISSTLWLKNDGLGRAMNIQSLNTMVNQPTVTVSQIGTGTLSRGLEITMGASTSALGLSVFQNGSSDAI